MGQKKFTTAQSNLCTVALVWHSIVQHNEHITRIYTVSHLAQNRTVLYCTAQLSTQQHSTNQYDTDNSTVGIWHSAVYHIMVPYKKVKNNTE